MAAAKVLILRFWNVWSKKITGPHPTGYIYTIYDLHVNTSNLKAIKSRFRAWLKNCLGLCGFSLLNELASFTQQLHSTHSPKYGHYSPAHLSFIYSQWCVLNTVFVLTLYLRHINLTSLIVWVDTVCSGTPCLYIIKYSYSCLCF